MNKPLWKWGGIYRNKKTGNCLVCVDANTWYWCSMDDGTKECWTMVKLKDGRLPFARSDNVTLENWREGFDLIGEMGELVTSYKPEEG